MWWEEGRYQDPTLRLAGGAAEYAKASCWEGGRERGGKSCDPNQVPEALRGSEEGKVGRRGRYKERRTEAVIHGKLKKKKKKRGKEMVRKEVLQVTVWYP